MDTDPRFELTKKGILKKFKKKSKGKTQKINFKSGKTESTKRKKTKKKGKKKYSRGRFILSIFFIKKH